MKPAGKESIWFLPMRNRIIETDGYRPRPLAQTSSSNFQISQKHQAGVLNCSNKGFQEHNWTPQVRCYGNQSSFRSHLTRKIRKSHGCHWLASIPSPIGNQGAFARRVQMQRDQYVLSSFVACSCGREDWEEIRDANAFRHRQDLLLFKPSNHDC